ncbi:MAG: CRISPR-associated endonuclease Cas1 [Bacteroidetes bacterium]|nr:CRISPR-associated endonuclease Cas1 [Bacteroidota bacterium]
MQIVLDTRGLQFSVRNKCFLIEAESESRIIHPSKVSSVLITAPCRISSPALVLAAQSEIPVIICNSWGKPEARIWSPRFINISTLRRRQYEYTSHPKSMDWAYNIILKKIDGQKSNLSFISDRKPSLAGDFEKALREIDAQLMKVKFSENGDPVVTKKTLLFVEAFTASRYWQLIGLKLPEPWNFTNRVKKQPNDSFNASVNYLYGMLRNQVETAVLSMGLDPALGVMHRDGYKMSSLVFDMMEPFRPVADRILIDNLLSGELTGNILEETGTGKLISKAGRKQLISLFNSKLKERIRFRESVTTLQNHILTEVRYLKERITDL